MGWCWDGGVKMPARPTSDAASADVDSRPFAHEWVSAKVAADPENSVLLAIRDALTPGDVDEELLLSRLWELSIRGQAHQPESE